MSAPKKFKFDYEINEAVCMACAACELECRDNAIVVNDSATAYAINKDSCKRCGRCFRACPAGAVVKINL
ncbi:4Fe-4S binding protein [Desulfurispora thermophila]|uniref:4Fe-4S binding protein n=1 Tax=Desulfurispora thermophila TaxID=265470 RepID=UPI00036C56A0|nr:4Fe-4S binding protein [Desulfurispora thermophila]